MLLTFVALICLIKSKSMFKSAVLSILNKGINAIVPLFLIPIINNVFGTAAFADLVYFQSIGGLVVTLADYGFSVSALKAVAVNRNKKFVLNEILVEITFIKALLLILFSILFYLCIFFFTNKIGDKLDSSLFVIVLMSLGLQSIIPSWFFQGLSMNDVNAKINVISKVFLVIGFFLFLFATPSILVLPFLESLSYVISLALSFYYIGRIFPIKYTKPTILNIQTQFRDGFNIFLIVLIYWSINGGSIIILEAYTSKFELGFFGIFIRFSYYLFAIFQPIILAVIPYFSEKFHISHREGINLYKRVFKFFFLIASLLLTIIYFSLDYILPIIFKQNIVFGYKENNLTVLGLFFWTFLLLLNNFSANAILLNNKKELIFRKAQIINGVVSVFLMLILVKFTGSKGVVLGMILGELAFFCVIFSETYIYNFKSFESNAKY